MFVASFPSSSILQTMESWVMSDNEARVFVLHPVCCSARLWNLAFVAKGYRHSALESIHGYLQEAPPLCFSPGNEAVVVYNM